MKKMLKAIFSFFVWLIRLGFLIFSLGLFFIINFFSGYQFLRHLIFGLGGQIVREQGLLGNDIYNIFSHINWLNRDFPKIPFWYPVEGTGTSLQYGYPILSHLITVFASRLTGLSIIESFRWLGFLSAFFVAVGIYFYGWLRIRSQLIGFLAGLFYLLSALAYSWLFSFGFYSESIGLVFMPWALICFEFFLESCRKGKWRKVPFWLLFSALFWGLAILCHYIIGIGLITLFFFLTISSFWKKRKLSKMRIKRGTLAILIFGFAVFGLWSFRLIPSARFLIIANREGLESARAFEQIAYSAPQLKTILGMIDPKLDSPEFKDADYFFKEYHFALPVTLLFLFGSLTCLLGSGLRLFVLFSWWAFIIFSSAKLRYFLMNGLPFGLFLFFDVRTFFSVARLMIPIVAAAGIWRAIAGIYELTARILLGKRKAQRGKLLKGLIVGSLVLGLLVPIFYFARKLPEDPPWLVRYGWNGPDAKGALDLRDIWRQGQDEICYPIEKPILAERLCQFDKVRKNFDIAELITICVQEKDVLRPIPDFCLPEKINEETIGQLLEWCNQEPNSVYCQARYESLLDQLRKNWPTLKASEQVDFLKEEEREFLRSLKKQGVKRYDVSPRLAKFINGSTFYTDVSRLTFSTHQLSLNHGFWGYLQGIYYTDDPVNKGPGVIEELARWFGIEEVFLEPDAPIENFDENFWQKIYQASGLTVIKTKEPLSLAEASNRPVFLVIGDFKKGVFYDLFKLSNKGVVPYDDFWLVEGRRFVDDYSLKELKNFDGLILHGYDYKNRSRGWRILDQYLTAGGKVFLNAGWQYIVPDWEIEEAPAFLPVKKTYWTDYGKTGDFWVNEGLLGEIQEEKFSSLVWDDQPWGVSGVNASDLQEGAEVLLSVKNHPLMVGSDYGEGRVIWSGVNLFAHSLENKNYEEIKFLGAVFKWLVKDKEKKDIKLEVLRTHPDKVEFVFNQDLEKGWLLWKEAFYPDWRAKLEGKKVSIYRGGPSLMMMPISKIKSGDQLVLYYRKPLFFYFLQILSLMTFLLLLLFMVGKGSLLKRILQRYQERSLVVGIKKIRRRLQEKWESDEY